MVQVSGLIVSFSLADLCLILYSESMEWLYWKETQMRESKPGFNIDHYFRNGEKRLLDESFGQVFLDGYAEYEERTYAFEFNGCKFHFCEHCGANPQKQVEEERRQRTGMLEFYFFDQISLRISLKIYKLTS